MADRCILLYIICEKDVVGGRLFSYSSAFNFGERFGSEGIPAKFFKNYCL